jgi:DNA end-binding protein Ku
MRSIWKGHIRFSLVTIPIRVYGAVDPAETIHFNQLHKADHGLIGYDKRCKKDNQIVSAQDIVKGYQYEPDRYVIIEAEDLDKVRLQSTKVIEVEGFVKAADVPATLYETPYFVGPDGEAARKAYALLREALKETGTVAVGKVVLRDREDFITVAPYESVLVLYKLRYPSELRPASEVPQLNSGKPVDPTELRLAIHLLETMMTRLADLEIRDRYNEALREIIQAKVEGTEIVTVTEEERPIVDIMAALKQSIEQAKERRQRTAKATGKTSAEPKKVPAEGAPARSRKRA